MYTIDSNGSLLSGGGLITTYDSKGNLIKLVNENKESSYEYDGRNGMFKNIKTPQWAMYLLLEDMHVFNVNNPTKTSYEDSEFHESNLSSFSYEYNSDNYPVKINVTGLDDFLNSVTIEYLKK